MVYALTCQFFLDNHWVSGETLYLFDSSQSACSFVEERNTHLSKEEEEGNGKIFYASSNEILPIKWTISAHEVHKS